MKRVLLGRCLLGLLGLVACGGRAIEQPGSGGSEGNLPVQTAGAAGGAGWAGAASGTNPFPSKELGPCTPGFKLSDHPMRPCPWLTEAGLCFQSSDAACNCACPTDRDSFCVHDFDSDPNATLPVFCG